MKTIIIGGGKIGYYLLKTLRERNKNVTLVERDMATCKDIAEGIDTEVVCGDGTDLEVLKDAGIENAEIIAAVTGSDEENLVICQIAKMNFNINKTIARINNPKNIAMFKALGVDKAVCSTEVIANLIEYEFDRDVYHIIHTFERGSKLIIEVDVTGGSPWCGKSVKDIELPEETVIISIISDDRIINPNVDTTVSMNDKILLMTGNHALADLKRRLHFKGV